MTGIIIITNIAVKQLFNRCNTLAILPMPMGKELLLKGKQLFGLRLIPQGETALGENSWIHQKQQNNSP